LLVYSYRYTFTLDLLLGKGKTEEMNAQTGDSEAESGEVAAFRERNLRTQRKTGIWGVILLFVASYLVIASIQLSFDTVAWSENRSIFFLLFSLNVIVKFLFFVIASLTITSGALLYYLFVNHIADTDPEYYTFARRFSLISGMITVVLLPLFILTGLIMTPSNALSDAFFMLSLLILFILFALSHLYFRMLKQPAINYSGYVFYLIIVLFVFFVINDQVAFSYAIQKQEVILVANYDRITAQAREKEGKGPVISGKEIFDGRCSACHRFDSKLVGPAYKDVLPKYEGHRDQLIAFISNPTKKNPAFPPMPNQGLKPKEVEAIAEYIMKTYKEK
ncbi:MAG: c-type cytochrome, partial [Ignavibacteriales bacterium]